MRFRSAIVFVGVMAAASAGTMACSSSSPPEAAASDDAAGTLSIALSAVGPDGATYSLPSGAVILAGPALSASSCTPLASTPTQTFSLPAGSYTATFFATSSCSGMYDAGSAWTLNRTGVDGGATTVTAQIVNNPVPFTVTANKTSNFALSFVIPQIGNVTLGTGSAVAVIQVDAGSAAAPTQAILSGVSITSPPAMGSNANVNAVLALPAGVMTVPVPYNIALKFTGPFAAGMDVACVPVTATITSTAMNANYAAFTDEISGATGKLCFADANTAVNIPNQVYLSITRTGAPSTAVFQMALGAMSSETWVMTWNWTTPTPIYDGSTVAFPGFGQAAPLNQSVLYTYVGPAGSNMFYAVTTGGQMGSTTTLTFMP